MEPRNGKGSSKKATKKSPATVTTCAFHYTSQTALDSIVACGQILISTKESKHAHSGEGVYLTTLRPELGKVKIAEKNWRSYGKFYIPKGRVEVAIEIEIPADKVEKVGESHRQILLHKGPICLNDYKWKVWKVPEESMYADSTLDDSDPSDDYDYDARDDYDYDPIDDRDPIDDYDFDPTDVVIFCP